MWEAFTGTVYETILPAQGCNFAVTFLDTERGRFVVKTGDTPEKIAALEREAVVLSALTPYQPAAPGFVARSGDHFLFTYIPGDDLSGVVQDVPASVREQLAEDAGRFLKQVHSWTPPLPHPAEDWLTAALSRCARNVERGAEVGADIHSVHYGKTNAELLDYLQRHRAEYETELVFGHGDWCLPNILADGDTVTGRGRLGRWRIRRLPL